MNSDTASSSQSPPKQAASSSPSESHPSHVVHIELFAGILTASQALASLGAQDGQLTNLYSEIEPRLVEEARTKFPHAFTLGDVSALIQDHDANHASTISTNPRIKLVEEIKSLLKVKCLRKVTFLVTAGFPCQDLSRAKKSKSLGLLGSRSCLIAAVTRILTALKTSFPDSDIAFVIENVASMDQHWRRLLDTALGVNGQDIDIADCAPCRRRRLIWTNIKDFDRLKVIKVDSASCLLPGWAPLQNLGLTTWVPNHRWDTFLRSREAGQPAELPLPFRKLSPFAYHAGNLVARDNLTEAEKLLVSERLREGDAYESQKFSMENRGKLIRWIHVEGGSEILRPLCGTERLRALGFPDSPDPPPAPFSDRDWELIDDTGNCFPLPAIKQILKPIVNYLNQGTPLHLHRWRIQNPSWCSFFTRLGLEVPPIPAPHVPVSSWFQTRQGSRH